MNFSERENAKHIEFNAVGTIFPMNLNLSFIRSFLFGSFVPHRKHIYLSIQWIRHTCMCIVHLQNAIQNAINVYVVIDAILRLSMLWVSCSPLDFLWLWNCRLLTLDDSVFFFMPFVCARAYGKIASEELLFKLQPRHPKCIWFLVHSTQRVIHQSGVAVQCMRLIKSLSESESSFLRVCEYAFTFFSIWRHWTWHQSKNAMNEK